MIMQSKCMKPHRSHAVTVENPSSLRRHKILEDTVGLSIIALGGLRSVLSRVFHGGGSGGSFSTGSSGSSASPSGDSPVKGSRITDKLRGMFGYSSSRQPVVPPVAVSARDLPASSLGSNSPYPAASVGRGYAKAKGNISKTIKATFKSHKGGTKGLGNIGKVPPIYSGASKRAPLFKNTSNKRPSLTHRRPLTPTALPRPSFSSTRVPSIRGGDKPASNQTPTYMTGKVAGEIVGPPAVDGRSPPRMADRPPASGWHRWFSPQSGRDGPSENSSGRAGSSGTYGAGWRDWLPDWHTHSRWSSRPYFPNAISRYEVWPYYNRHYNRRVYQEPFRFGRPEYTHRHDQLPVGPRYLTRPYGNDQFADDSDKGYRDSRFHEVSAVRGMTTARPKDEDRIQRSFAQFVDSCVRCNLNRVAAEEGSNEMKLLLELLRALVMRRVNPLLKYKNKAPQEDERLKTRMKVDLLYTDIEHLSGFLKHGWEEYESKICVANLHFYSEILDRLDALKAKLIADDKPWEPSAVNSKISLRLAMDPSVAKSALSTSGEGDEHVVRPGLTEGRSNESSGNLQGPEKNDTGRNDTGRNDTEAEEDASSILEETVNAGELSSSLENARVDESDESSESPLVLVLD